MIGNTKDEIMRVVSVIGSGSWGTAVANVIAHNHPDITVKMWAYEKDVVKSINTKHINEMYLPETVLAANIVAFHDIKESVKNADAIILATPSKVVYDTCLKVRNYLNANVYFGYLSKGFCKIGSGIYTMSQTIELALPFLIDKVCAIYGPSHAEEVCKKYHTVVHVCSKSNASINFFMNLLSNDFFECIPCHDIIGVDCGSTLKNPAAIAAGIISMLPQCGDNLVGALIAQAHVEMQQLASCLGAEPATIMGIAGLGDLVATALSPHSRNRRFGREIASQINQKGTILGVFDKILLRIKPESVLTRMGEHMNYLVEGAYAIEPIIELADKYNLIMPVYRSLYDVLLNKRDPWLLIETIKNPAKYEILTRRARIKVKERKKGIERVNGLIFKNIVVENLVQQLSTEDSKSKILAQKKEYEKLLHEHIIHTRNKEFLKELSLYKNLDTLHYEKKLKTLIAFYYDSISDRYVYTISLLMLKAARLFFYFYGLLYRRRIIEFFEERISLTGDINYLKKIVMTANPVYFCNAKDKADSLFVVLALIKFISIPLPRFYVDNQLAENRLLRFLFRLCGGYIVNTIRFSSIIYRETLLQYISACVEHGIPILYAYEPSNQFLDMPIQDTIIERLCQLLQKTTEEIAIIPVGVGHKYFNPLTRPISFLKIFRNVTQVHISRAITLSHLSASSTLSNDIQMMLRVKQRHDIPIYLHYFLAYALQVLGNTATIDAIKEEVDSILRLRNLKHRYSVETILSEGLDFLMSNRFISINDNIITVNEDKKQAIEYFAAYLV